jgi:hypothetical protein
MSGSRSALIETALLVLVFAVASAFLVSFVRGIAGGSDEAAVAAGPAETFTPANLDTRRVGRIEVLNAARTAGLARDATQRLRTAGFDVVYFGNTSAADPDSSVVYDRTGDDDVARAAADVLGIRRVITRADTTLYVDATVILGADWRPRPAAR